MLRLDPTTIDPGIRAVVAFLHEHGFDTTDSGDGRSKVGALAAGDAEPIAHVHMTVERDTALREADRLHRLLLAEGVAVGPFSAERGAGIQLSYDPADGTAVLSLYGLDDAGLGRARTIPLVPSKDQP